jgi:hypothetical protein
MKFAKKDVEFLLAFLCGFIAKDRGTDGWKGNFLGQNLFCDFKPLKPHPLYVRHRLVIISGPTWKSTTQQGMAIYRASTDK